MDADSNNLGDMLGSGAPAQGTHIVYNITYNNSFNRDDHSDHSTRSDLSTGKSINKSNNVTTTHTNSHNVNSSKPDKLSVSVSADIDKGSNNNNNSNGKVDNKDSKVQEFASGFSVDDVFAFLESESPISMVTEATTKPHKGDSLTNAMMDLDRSSRSLQQKSKRSVQKGVGFTKALLKPATRTKQWLAGIIDSLIKRNEDTVKTEIVENDGYRSTLFKASRLACKLGMFGIVATINGYLGAAYVALQASRFVDKERLKREVSKEMSTEIKIIEDKIKKADEDNDLQAKYKMMRLKSRMEQIVEGVPRANVKHSRSVS